jgi:ParB/RepB/Spo0J family partition protein
MMAKTKSGVELASMIPISSILVSGDIPNRSEGWEAELDELMDSIKASGQVQPIVVLPLDTPGENGEQYKLLAGQRRLEALKRLKHTNIKAVSARTKSTQKDQFSVKLAENFGRIDYTPLEEATLIAYAVSELGISQQDLAKKIGKTPGWVSQRLAASKQPVEVQHALEEGDITFTHARELSRVKDEEEKKKLLSRAKRENAQDFKETVDGFVLSGKLPKPGNKKREGASGNKASGVEIRPKSEAGKMLKRLDKALVKAKKAEDKEKAKYISWYMRGISWAYKLKNSDPPK